MAAPLKAMSKEDNQRLTQVRAGTEMGDLLRRYWWAVGISADVKDKPTFFCARLASRVAASSINA